MLRIDLEHQGTAVQLKHSQKMTYRITSESGNNDEISVFKVKGSTVREINDSLLL